MELGCEDVVGVADLFDSLDLDDFVSEHLDLSQLWDLSDNCNNFLFINVDLFDDFVNDGHHHIVLDCVLEDLVDLYQVINIDGNFNIFGHFDNLLYNLLDFNNLRHIDDFFYNLLYDLWNLHNLLHNLLHWYKPFHNYLHLLHILLHDNLSGR